MVSNDLGLRFGTSVVEDDALRYSFFQSLKIALLISHADKLQACSADSFRAFGWLVYPSVNSVWLVAKGLICRIIGR